MSIRNYALNHVLLKRRLNYRNKHFPEHQTKKNREREREGWGRGRVREQDTFRDSSEVHEVHRGRAQLLGRNIAGVSRFTYYGRSNPIRPDYRRNPREDEVWRIALYKGKISSASTEPVSNAPMRLSRNTLRFSNYRPRAFLSTPESSPRNVNKNNGATARNFGRGCDATHHARSALYIFGIKVCYRGERIFDVWFNRGETMVLGNGN